MSMTSRLLKKSEMDEAGLWVRPVRLAPDFAEAAPPTPLVAPAAAEADSEAAHFARIRHLLHDLTTQLAHDKERLLDELQPHLVRLALAIARRIVAAEIRQDQHLVERTVRAALEELACEGELHVRVHPDDAPLVRRVLATEESFGEGFSDLRVLADQTIERGGCIVESDHGIIDADIPTQFAQIQRTLLAYLEQ